MHCMCEQSRNSVQRQEEKSQETLTLCSEPQTHSSSPARPLPFPAHHRPLHRTCTTAASHGDHHTGALLRSPPRRPRALPPPPLPPRTRRSRCPRSRCRATRARTRFHRARRRRALMLHHHTPCLLTISAPPLPSSTYLCLTPTTTARTSARHSAQHALVAAGAQWRVWRMFPRGASSGHAWSILRPPVVDEVLSDFRTHGGAELVCTTRPTRLRPC